MWKLVAIIVSIIIFTIFFIQNMVKVPVRLIVTEAVDIRLTYLLLTSFCVGYLFCSVTNVIRRVRKNEMEKRYYSDDLEEEDE